MNDELKSCQYGNENGGGVSYRTLGTQLHPISMLRLSARLLLLLCHHYYYTAHNKFSNFLCFASFVLTFVQY